MKRKERPRTKATFAEHVKLFSVPFLITSTLSVVLYPSLNWLIHHYSFGREILWDFWFPLLIALLILFLVFIPRIRLLSFEHPKSDFVLMLTCGVGHWLLIMFAQKLGANYFKPVTEPYEEGFENKPIYFLIAFIGLQVIWLIFTNIPVLEKHKLDAFNDKRK